METVLAFYSDLGIDLNDLKQPISAKIHQTQLLTGNDRIVSEFHLKRLGLALMDIKANDEEIYKFYVKRIAKNANISVLGFIFEVTQCLQLMETAKRENLSFQFGDHNKKEPDFFLDGCGFEITSVRYNEDSKKDAPSRKVLNTFRDKNKKEYAKSDTVLVLEMSHVADAANTSGIFDTPFSEAQQIMRDESKFGLVICVTDIIDFENGALRSKGGTHVAWGKCFSPKIPILIHKITQGKKLNLQSEPKIAPF